MSGAPVAAVVVQYRTPEALDRCLDVLRREAGDGATIVVVDNSAAEARLDGISSAHPSVTWISPSGNLGFAAACNLGAAATDAPLLLFVNPDVELGQGALGHLRQRLEAEPRCALVAPRIWDAAGRIELNARAFPSVRTGVLGRTSPVTRALTRLGRAPAALAPATGGAHEVDWVSGACQLVRRDAFDAIGGFDEDYWMYWEDADLCWRLRDARWTVWFEPAAEATHATGSSGRSRRSVRAFHDSAALFYERHVARSRVDAALARTALRIRAAIKLRSLES